MNKILIKLSIITWCLSSYIITTSNNHLVTLSADQVEMLQEFKQDLASISATARLEWKSNPEVNELVEQIERSVQQSDPTQRHIFKVHIKYMFQAAGISIRYTNQNLIERSAEKPLFAQAKIIQKQNDLKQSLDQAVKPNDPAQSKDIKANSSTACKCRPIRYKSITYWKKKMAQRQARMLMI